MGKGKLIKRLADRLDQIILVFIFAMLFFRLMPNGHWEGNIHALMILISEGVVLLFVLIRRKTDKISTSFSAC
jgi:hypothetical protein